MMQFDLVSPERRLASLEVSEVRVPGADGDMTAMADHAHRPSRRCAPASCR
jgi:F-type H+-transporting ATPase subunit epsilon